MDEIALNQQLMFEDYVLPKFTDFEFDQNLTADTYISVIRKMLACVRHWAHLECQKTFAESGKKQLTDQEAEDLLAKIQETKQEEYRLQILQKYNISVPAGTPPKRIMQRAYLTFATQRPHGLQNNKPWMDKVQHEHQIHAKIFDKICRNEKVEGIEEDPLEGPEIDNYEAVLVPGTLFKRKNDQGEEEVSLQPDAKSIDEADQLLSKHKKKRAGGEASESQAEAPSALAESQVIDAPVQ